MSNRAIGIDLGTTHSCVAIFNDVKQSVDIIIDEKGNRIMPSVVTFTEGEFYTGYEAVKAISWNAENTVFDAKRLIGRKYNHPEVQSDMKRWPFVVKDVEGKPKIQVVLKGTTEMFLAEQISAKVLAKLKELAEIHLKRKTVTHAVITVPANFTDSQRRATKDAASIAGLTVLHIINEPTAAAIAYGLDKKDKYGHNVLVYDLGGGTLDVSIIKIKNGAFVVLGSDGDCHLGGNDFDCRMVDYFIEEIKENKKRDIQHNRRAICRLRQACERAKRKLSEHNVAKIELTNLYDETNFFSQISRGTFERINEDLFCKTLKSVEQALENADMKKSDIQDIVIVGGSVRIPKIQELLEKMFDGKKLDQSIHPDEAVAYGAAINAAFHSHEKFEIPKGIKNTMLMDISPLSIGIETEGKVMSTVIDKNTRIPTRESKMYTTSRDNQSCILIKVFEGERVITNDNNLLGQFTLEGIQKAPRGEPNIEITIDIDDDCTLKISATDNTTLAKNEMFISSDMRRLSAEDIERMIADSRVHKIVDEIQRDRITAKISLTKLIYGMKKTCEIFKDRLTENEKEQTLKICRQTFSWLDQKTNATREEFESRQREVEMFWNLIMAKLLPMQGSGSMDGEGDASFIGDFD